MAQQVGMAGAPGAPSPRSASCPGGHGRLRRASELTDVWKDPSFTSARCTTSSSWCCGRIRCAAGCGRTSSPGPGRARPDRDLLVPALPRAPPDTQEVIDAVRQNGYDAVLHVRPAARRDDEHLRARRDEARDGGDAGLLRFLPHLLEDVQDPGTRDRRDQLVPDRGLGHGGGGGLVCSVKLRTLESVTSRTIGLAVTRYIDPSWRSRGWSRSGSSVRAAESGSS